MSGILGGASLDSFLQHQLRVMARTVEESLDAIQRAHCRKARHALIEALRWRIIEIEGEALIAGDESASAEV